MTPEDWVNEQVKPLSMFEIAKWWADGLKVVGAGNGAGFLTCGAAFAAFHDHPRGLFAIKVSGVCFFIGIVTFALAFLLIHIAMHAQDEVAQATMHKDAKRIEEQSVISGSSMDQANRLAIVSTIAFFAGCAVGLVAFLSF
jgi:mannitol-specific phosphotransferase system IIBC component